MLAKKWDRCTRCVQSASFPRIKFDEEGVCNFCKGEVGAATEDIAIDDARKRFEALLSDTPRHGAYDALMCYSGGKDSTYVLAKAVQKYNMRVLAFTMDNGFLSDMAAVNINRVVESLGVDLLTMRPAKRDFVSIVRTCMLEPVFSPHSLTRISAGCNACISMVNMMALRIALEKRIPFILAGFTLGQIPANGIIYQNNYRFLQESRESSMRKLRESAGPRVDHYLTIDEQTLDASIAPITVNPLCMETITEDQIVAAVEEIGWVSPGDVDGCSSNCRLNTFNNYVHQRRFGFHPYELELSHLIRKGLMTREEALGKMEKQSEEQRRQLQEEMGILESQIKPAETSHA